MTNCKVIVEYNRYNKPSKEFIVQAGNEMLSESTLTTTKFGFVMHELGVINLKKGHHLVKIYPNGIRGILTDDLMNLRALHFNPIIDDKK